MCLVLFLSWSLEATCVKLVAVIISCFAKVVTPTTMLLTLFFPGVGKQVYIEVSGH